MIQHRAVVCEPRMNKRFIDIHLRFLSGKDKDMTVRNRAEQNWQKKAKAEGCQYGFYFLDITTFIQSGWQLSRKNCSFAATSTFLEDHCHRRTVLV